MKDEDADWLVYHRIPVNSAIAEEDLASTCSLDAPGIAGSLARLERSCLVERSGNMIRMLNFGEALLRNQCKYEKDLPFTIENGVIREKKRTP
ncbi:MAG: MarR family transcriptional regulator [Methanomicrobiales archaeon]